MAQVIVQDNFLDKDYFQELKDIVFKKSQKEDSENDKQLDQTA